MEAIRGDGLGFPGKVESADLQGKRLKGFEPSTFCMATGQVARDLKDVNLAIYR
jgi:hypothetical protein